jgi:hypothetical protein
LYVRTLLGHEPRLRERVAKAVSEAGWGLRAHRGLRGAGHAAGRLGKRNGRRRGNGCYCGSHELSPQARM